MSARSDDARRHDALYVSPHEDDVWLSCAGRLLSEKAQGLRPLVVIVFSSGVRGDGDAGGALERMGIATRRLGFSPAPERNEFYRSFDRASFERHSEDERVVAELSSRLNDLAVETRARHVYLPLGAGSHVDHRLCHDAGLRALHEGTGRNVFFYEDRPPALIPGTVRMRLSALGARLPPVATNIRDETSLLRLLWRHQRAGFVRAERLGLRERARYLRGLAASFRSARVWNPLRAFGLRLQPVLEGLAESDSDGVLSVLGAEPRVAELFGSRQRLEQLCRAHAKRLGSPPYVERYWLLLPPRDEAGVISASIVGATPEES